jgi:phosphoglycolate phosphatase
MKLLLWDIDGTLVCTDAAGERALLRALKTLHDVEGSLKEIDYRGRTDAFIARRLFEHYRIPATPQNLHDYLEHYLKFLREELLQGRPKAHPGIFDILEQAQGRKDLVQGLLTGNLARGARIKLEHFDVWRYFEFGAFADDSSIRDELGPVALRRAGEHAGREILPENVFIIGDTPHDISCARVIGARAIAVATGGFTVTDLARHEPFAVLPDFGDPRKFFALIDSV